MVGCYHDEAVVVQPCAFQMLKIQSNLSVGIVTRIEITGKVSRYSFIRYRYLPAWADYDEVIKDNPSDYMNAFCQLVYALKYLKGGADEFIVDTYEKDAVEPFKDEIDAFLRKRQLSASADWKSLGERLSGHEIEPFDLEKYVDEYMLSSKEDKGSTFLGRFFDAAMAQKAMVTLKIFESGNLLAGIPYKGARMKRRGEKKH